MKCEDKETLIAEKKISPEATGLIIVVGFCLRLDGQERALRRLVHDEVYVFIDLRYTRIGRQTRVLVQPIQIEVQSSKHIPWIFLSSLTRSFCGVYLGYNNI